MQKANVFQENYQAYCTQIAALDFTSIHDHLGAALEKDSLRIGFFNTDYWVSKEGIHDVSGKRAGYAVAIILAKYILLCPGEIQEEPAWVSFKDFKSDPYRSAVTAFVPVSEKTIKNRFSGRLAELKTACENFGGTPVSMDVSYELAMEFRALPRISVLLLFNDKDEEFPADARILFQKQAEHYLDPESLGMVSGFLAESLKRMVMQ